MLLDAIIVVLREIVEMVIVVSTILLVSRNTIHWTAWVPPALALSFLITPLYALNMSFIADLFDYRGLEISRVIMQLILLISMLVAIGFFSALSMKNIVGKLALSSAFIASTSYELSEIYLYVSSFSQNEEAFSSVLTGALIGASVGVSFGVLFYNTFHFIRPYWQEKLALFLSFLVCAVAASSCTHLLMQCGLISDSGALWDSSMILSEHSILGEVLTAVLGYESTPNLIYLLCYLGGGSSVYLINHFYKK